MLVAQAAEFTYTKKEESDQCEIKPWFNETVLGDKGTSPCLW